MTRTLSCTLLAVACSLTLPCAVANAQQDAYTLNARLLAATREGDQAAVTRLLDEGAAIDSRNRIGDTPLISACKKGLTPMARMLIERGANVSQADVQGITPLMASAFDGNDEIAALLIAHHADVAATDRVGKTAMESTPPGRDTRPSCSACSMPVWM